MQALPGLGSALATGAVEAGPLSHDTPPDGGSAVPAGLSGATIHKVLLLEVARLTICANKVPQGAAACREGCLQGAANGLHESGATGQPEGVGGGVRGDAGPEQAFGGVDVAHPHNPVPVHDEAADRGAAPPGGLVQPRPGEACFQGLDAQPGQ